MALMALAVETTGRDGDDLEAGRSEKRLSGGREHVVTLAHDRRRREVADSDECDQHVEDDDATDRDQVGARQRSLRVSGVLGSVCDQLETLVAEEDQRAGVDDDAE